MSPCPLCGTTGKHVAVLVPWERTGRAGVDHRCPNCGLTWTEPAQDLPALLARCVRNLGPSPLELMAKRLEPPSQVPPAPPSVPTPDPAPPRPPPYAGSVDALWLHRGGKWHGEALPRDATDEDLAAALAILMQATGLVKLPPPNPIAGDCPPGCHDVYDGPMTSREHAPDCPTRGVRRP